MAINAPGANNFLLSADRQSADPEVFCDTPLEDDVDSAYVWSDHNLLAFGQLWLPRLAAYRAYTDGITDGGGIRGYWSLLVMKQLMDIISQLEIEHKTCKATHSFHPLPYPEDVSQVPYNEEEKRNHRKHDPADKIQGLDAARRYLPCHYFDLIGGTSTGALIAIMLGRLRMTVQDCLHEYENLGNEIFGNAPPFGFRTFRMLLTKQPKYSSGNVERVFRAVVDKRREAKKAVPHSTSRPRFRSEPNICQTFITTLFSSPKNGLRASLHLMRTYDRLVAQPSRPEVNGAPVRKKSYASPEFTHGQARQLTNDTGRSIEAATELEIWQVARAAIAGAKYFSPLTVQNADNEDISHEDAAVNVPNPTREGLLEIEHQFGLGAIGTVVSVGTAKADNIERDGKPLWLFGTALRVVDNATNPELVHRAVQDRADSERFPYFRFNPEDQDDRLSTMFDEWKPSKARKGLVAGSDTLRSMNHKFQKWYNSDKSIETMFHRCASELVGRRRKRVLNSAKWERYITGTTYRCGYGECSENNLMFSLRDQFEQHCKSKHYEEPNFNLEEEVKRARREAWRYQTKKDEKRRGRCVD
ncbi:hypothetical protein LTR27_008520 [Elasticomyces elasticus]|nr:hypothetical protein LTR27_008520 [Elasticomyces elasticus]